MNKIVSEERLDIHSLLQEGVALSLNAFKSLYPTGEIDQNGIRLVINEDKATYELFINGILVAEQPEKMTMALSPTWLHIDDRETILCLGCFFVAVHGPLKEVAVFADELHWERKYSGGFSSSDDNGKYLLLRHAVNYGRLKNGMPEAIPFGIAEWLLSIYTCSHFYLLEKTGDEYAALSLSGKTGIMWKWKVGDPRPADIADMLIFSIDEDFSIKGCSRGVFPEKMEEPGAPVVTKVKGCGKHHGEDIHVEVLSTSPFS